jgi:hypothetical protein
MSPPVATVEELRLRTELDAAVRRIDSALRRCPAVEDLNVIDTARATSAVVAAGQALREAEECTSTLEALRGASEEAIVLVATSRAALGIVAEVLAVLCAAIDAQPKAA